MNVVTPETWYRLWWAGVWIVTMVTLWFIVSRGTRWGVQHGMDRFVQEEKKQ